MELIKYKRKEQTLCYIERITKLLEDNGEMTIIELRLALGITSARYNTLIMDVTNVMPIYETDDGKLGLIHRG